MRRLREQRNEYVVRMVLSTQCCAIARCRTTPKPGAATRRLRGSADAHRLQGLVPSRYCLRLQAVRANVAGAAPDLGFGVRHNVSGIAVVAASTDEAFVHALGGSGGEAKELEARCALEIVGQLDSCAVGIV
jgi:hypothetical protein